VILAKSSSVGTFALRTKSHSPGSVRLSSYHSPKNVYIRTDDPDFPGFYFDPLINPISLRAFTPKNAPLVSHEDSIFGLNDADDNEFELSEDVSPFLEHKALEMI
jgi:pre-mRNA-processing factor 8